MPAHAGERVVAGARALSPHLGDRMAAGDLAGRPVVVRELLPEDIKLDIEQFTRKEAVGAARYLSGVVGKAHGRQLSRDDRAAWLRELETRHAPDLAAPTWLWNVVVALLVRHEEAYLTHCRSVLPDAPRPSRDRWHEREQAASESDALFDTLETDEPANHAGTRETFATRSRAAAD
jgi:uncharacterized protein (DUF2252 family)